MSPYKEWLEFKETLVKREPYKVVSLWLLIIWSDRYAGIKDED